MAKKITIPLLAREVCRQLVEALNRPWLGIPMTIEMPPILGQDENGLEGVCRVRFENGQHFKVGIHTFFLKDIGHCVSMTSIEGSMKFPSQMEAIDFVVELERFAGTFNWHTETCDTRERLKFKIKGLPLERLKLAGEHRRRGLPTYVWDDPNHPFNK
jgi:hypothetical protein